MAGKRLLAYTIEAATKSSYIDATYLSSDSEEILQVGAVFGIHLIRRPAELATDDATANQVVRHFISVLDDDLRSKDPFLVYLQPTSPLRSSAHVDEAIEMMTNAGRKSLISVVSLEQSPFKSFTLSADGTLKSLFDERYSNFNRQQLPPAFIPNGAIYIFQLSEFGAGFGFPSNGSFPYIMSASLSIDIDSEDDLLKAERHFEAQK